MVEAFCPIFIHIGIIHLLMNMYFLNNVGDVFESLYGSTKFLIIYLLCGIMGNLFTYAFGEVTSVSAGASTSLYGLFGLALGIMFNYRDNEFLRQFGSSFIGIVAINIIYSFMVPGIGITGHIGGLFGRIYSCRIFPNNEYDFANKHKNYFPSSLCANCNRLCIYRK